MVHRCVFRACLIAALAATVLAVGAVLLAAGVGRASEKVASESEKAERTRPAERRRPQAGLRVGQQAPDLELSPVSFVKDGAGQQVARIGAEKVRLSSLRGRKCVCLFFSSYT